MSLCLRFVTAWRLGLPNVLRVLYYRLGVRIGFHPVRRISTARPQGPFFRLYKGEIRELPTRIGWWHRREAYGVDIGPIDDDPPDWHQAGIRPFLSDPHRPWWELPDFDPTTGDVKDVWEASRFDWILAGAQQAASGNPAGVVRLNAWMGNWVDANPPYRGANWKCGQEASIRVLHIAMATMILDQVDDATRGLIDVLVMHLRRIAPTIQYAVAQDNNHGTSEAAALFIGGTLLASEGKHEGIKWERAGRRWLENRVLRLVQSDGSFSQYSVNYHRVLLDTLSMVEAWRRRRSIAPFSNDFYGRVRAAVGWLANVVDTDTGDAPNLGANDGARLLPLADTDYRDFRPTVQLASILFTGSRAYKERGSFDLPSRWLDIQIPMETNDWRSSRDYSDGGMAVLRAGNDFVAIRYPRFRFRPSHSDLLHIDLWHNGENLLRDGGSYRYHTESEWLEYFPGVKSHNTIQFDARDQMPRLGRFLFGAWPKACGIEPLSEEEDRITFAVGYRDWKSASHHRRLVLSSSYLRVEDRIAGFQSSAVLRWRLLPCAWRWDADFLTDGIRRLRVVASVPIVRKDLVEGWESRYYGRKTSLPVLEVEVHEPCTFISEFLLPS